MSTKSFEPDNFANAPELERENGVALEELTPARLEALKQLTLSKPESAPASFAAAGSELSDGPIATLMHRHPGLTKEEAMDLYEKFGG